MMNNDDDNESLASLIKLAGERPEIPLGIESRVRHRVQEEWLVSSREPSIDKVYDQVHKTWRRDALRGKLLRWLIPAGVAATAVMLTMYISQPDPVVVSVAATVSRVVGSGDISARYSEGKSVHSGDIISTGPSEGLSLLLARSESLRIDENTRVRIDAADQFTLLSGRIYADTGQFIYRDGGLRIDTALGTVTDIGTQFSVGLIEDSLDVAVREGRVDVRNQTDTYAARMGERLVLVDGEGASVSELDTHDNYWSWIVGLTPTYELTNKSLLDFLKWAARETGREIDFESDELRMSAMRTDVHGSVKGMTPDEALRAILSTTTVKYRIEADAIIVED
jgi:ferric-dicitrate binding protein FerR (iron transport regulator)